MDSIYHDKQPREPGSPGANQRPLVSLCIVTSIAAVFVMLLATVALLNGSFYAGRMSAQVDSNHELLRDLVEEVHEINEKVGDEHDEEGTHPTPMPTTTTAATITTTEPRTTSRPTPPTLNSTCVDGSVPSRWKKRSVTGANLTPMADPNNAISALNEQLKGHEFRADYVTEADRNAAFVYKCILTYRIYVPDPETGAEPVFVFEAWGESAQSESKVKKVAQHAAAYKALACFFPDAAAGLRPPEGAMWHMEPPNC